LNAKNISGASAENQLRFAIGMLVGLTEKFFAQESGANDKFLIFHKAPHRAVLVRIRRFF
jgi:hypothetical protein